MGGIIIIIAENLQITLEVTVVITVGLVREQERGHGFVMIFQAVSSESL